MTQQINDLIQTSITLHNTNMQLGRFISDYIDFKGDTDGFQKFVNEKIAEEQQNSNEEGVSDGEQE